MLQRIKACLSYFFYETFRPRGARDYRAAFGQAMDYPSIDPPKPHVPWLYLRFWSVALILYTVLALLNTAFCIEEGIEYPFAGALVWNITWLLLVFECMYDAQIPFPIYLCLFIGGGVLSIGVLLLAVDLHDTWIVEPYFCYFEIFEEFSKGFVAVALILILRKRKPMDGALVGAAVGAGFAFIEDIDYIDSEYMFSESVATAMQRGAESIIGHMAWTACIAYAFCRFRKPWRNPRFYGCVALSIFLHTFWNFDWKSFLPLFDTNWFLWTQSTCCFLFNVALWIWILFSENKRQKEIASADEKEVPESIQIAARPGYPYRYCRALSAMVAAVLLAGCGILFAVTDESTGISSYYASSIYPPITVTEKVTGERTCLGTVEEFLQTVHGDRTLAVDWNRPLDPSLVNAYEEWYDGSCAQAVQTVLCEGGSLSYRYRAEREDGTVVGDLVLTTVEYIPDNEEEYEITACILYSTDWENPPDFPTDSMVYGKDYIYFFDYQNKLEAYYTGFYHHGFFTGLTLEGGYVYGVSEIAEDVPLKVLSDWQTVSAILAGAVLLAEGATLWILKQKQKKKAFSNYMA